MIAHFNRVMQVLSFGHACLGAHRIRPPSRRVKTTDIWPRRPPDKNCEAASASVRPRDGGLAVIHRYQFAIGR